MADVRLHVVSWLWPDPQNRGNRGRNGKLPSRELPINSGAAKERVDEITFGAGGRGYE